MTSPSIPRRIRRTPDVAAHSLPASPLPKGWHEQSAESTRARTTRVKKRGNTCGAKCGHRHASSHTDEVGPQDTTDDSRPTTVRVRYVVASDLLFRSGPNFVSSLLVLHSRSALPLVTCNSALPSAKCNVPSLMVLWSLQLGFHGTMITALRSGSVGRSVPNVQSNSITGIFSSSRFSRLFSSHLDQLHSLCGQSPRVRCLPVGFCRLFRGFLVGLVKVLLVLFGLQGALSLVFLCRLAHGSFQLCVANTGCRHRSRGQR